MFCEEERENVPTNGGASRSGEKRAKQLKRRSIQTLNRPGTNNTIQQQIKGRIPTRIQERVAPSKFSGVRSSGYGRVKKQGDGGGPRAERTMRGAGTAARSPVYLKRGAVTSSSTSTSFPRGGGASKRSGGSGVPDTTLAAKRRREGGRMVSDVSGDHDILKEKMDVLEARITNVEMAKAVVPARAASHLTQEAYDHLKTELQNAINTIQQKDQDLLGKETQLALCRARMETLEMECAGKKAVMEEQTVNIHKMSAQLSTERARVGALTAELEEKEGLLARHTATIASLSREKKEQALQLGRYELKQRDLHEMVQDLKGNIRVYCRVRPFLPSEEGKMDHLSFPDADDEKKSLALVNYIGAPQSVGRAQGKWKLDRVFSPHTTQADLFLELEELVQSSLHGFNVSVFAYGQTGSGKTYTMEGGPDPETATFHPDSEGSGVIPRAVLLIFKAQKELEKLGWKYMFKLSFMEIYNEELRDLLAVPGRESDVRGRKGGKLEVCVSGKEAVVSGLTLTEVQTPQEVLGLAYEALKRRSVGSTRCNERSSRSHAIFQLHISSQDPHGRQMSSLLNLVDLAGSERLKESESSGSRLTEAQHINSSLSTLKTVIRNQAQKNGKGKDGGGHVPFRNSKLTMVLKNSLGGGRSKTLMLTTVNPVPENAEETKRTLEFAVEANQCYIGTATRHPSASSIKK